MKNKRFSRLPALMLMLLATACFGSRFGSKKKERFFLYPEKNDVVLNAMARAKAQGHPLTLDARIRGGRGLLTNFSGGILSLGIGAVDSLISKNKKQYTDTWAYGKNDFYFYDQPSPEGPFDPVGMQFTGFELDRYVKIDQRDVTAVHAEFEVNTDDSTASAQLINDGVFRLKVRDIAVHYAKAKVPIEKQYINLDFEITFTTSYITREGQFYTDVTLGKMLFTIRHAPLDSAANPAAYRDYYARLKNMPLTGKCIIVPRSYGYYKSIDTAKSAFKLVPYWNQGNFSINVKVTESSKDKFTSVILTSAGAIIAIEGGNLIAPKSPGSSGPGK
jgi:hypothetical protein